MTWRTLLLIVGVASCSGGAGIGDTCLSTGTTDECVAEAICTDEDSGDGSRCRKICTEHSDCDAGENCNGVSGSSTKSCQPKD